MRYELIKEINLNFSPVEQILTNRGIPIDVIPHYLNTTDEDINDFNLLGEKSLSQAYESITDAIEEGWNCLVIVDSDCDGFTSAAILINYLYDMARDWVLNHLTYVMHTGKQHGLADIEVPDDIDVVIVPDAGSNDYVEHEDLADRNKIVIVLDHHEAEKISEYAIIINNQLSDYPNKFLSGAGVTWQFCKYIDSRNGTDYADTYLDLVALGLDADMMSLRSLETKHLINRGLYQLKQSNVGFGPSPANPFFFEMVKKNSFSLKGELTPIGVAFYVAPYVNSMVRSGTQEEKRLLFQSMLKFEAFKRIPSNKRGHKPGEEERLVDQAIRTAINVKSRQTKSQTAGLEVLESKIIDENLLENKVLLFLCEPGEIPKNIAGLVANKFMAKYQRNTAILFRGTNEDGEMIWSGSARGSTKSSIESFKDLCEETGLVEYAQGHAGAFGLSIKDINLTKFISITNKLLAADSGETTYHVDYIYEGENVNGNDILEIANLEYLWGQDMPESLIAIKNLKITGNMLTLMSADKNPTLKIALPNGISILKFKSSQEEYEKLYSEQGYKEITLVGTCNKNEWNGNISPQVFIKDYEIIDSSKYYF